MIISRLPCSTRGDNYAWKDVGRVESPMMSTDVGCAWIVCSAACIVHFVVCGIQNSYGVLYIYIMKELRAGDKATAGKDDC